MVASKVESSLKKLFLFNSIIFHKAFLDVIAITITFQLPTPLNKNSPVSYSILNTLAIG